MSGRSGFQTWTNSSYKHVPGSYNTASNSEDMWDDPSSTMTHVTQVFHNQSLKTTAQDDWDAWDCSYTPNTVNVPENHNKVRNFDGADRRHDNMWHSSGSVQRPNMFDQQNESLHNSDDPAPYEMKISSRHVGLVIGKGGSRIRELQASSGAKINVRKNYVDASGMVLVTLDGDIESRSNAKKMLDELTANDSNYPNAGRMENFQNQQASEHFSDGGGVHGETGLTVSSSMLGAIFGRGGQKIREIEGKTQTKIKIGDNRNAATVDVTIRGSADGRQQAKLLIDDVITAESETGYGLKSERSNFGDRPASNQQNLWSDSTKLQIPTSMLGAIIGRGGQHIRDMSDKTQTKIKIADDRSGAFVDVTITGDENGRLQAKSVIEDIIQSAGETGYTSHADRPSFNDNQSANKHRSGFPDFNSDHKEANDRSHSMQNSDRSGFDDCRTGSRQRSGFGNFDQYESAERSFGNVSSSSFGSSVHRCGFDGMSARINWDQVKELSEKHEQQKWSSYPPIKKNFYIEDADVANMEPEEIAALREQNNNIMVSCDEDSEVRIPNPVRTFDEGFLHYPEILSELKRAGFSNPSPIQMQGWPIALQGLDLIGIAQTGTGKTLAFLLPAFIHIEGQPVPRDQRGGPNVLVLSPTRELALQVGKWLCFSTLVLNIFIFTVKIIVEVFIDCY